jgi:multicomponent Na+:H+ antiporter subunit G
VIETLGPLGAIRVGLIVAFTLLGLFFTFVSMTGVLRLPDVYSRAHTASQADTLGAGFALAGVALAIGLDSTGLKTVLLLFFLFVTNPTAAHAIARAAHEEGVEPWTTGDADDGTPGPDDAAAAPEPSTAPSESGTAASDSGTAASESGTAASESGGVDGAVDTGGEGS